MASRSDFANQVRAVLLQSLINYFTSADGDQGLRSSWGPLVDIAMGGFGGVPDPERSVSDWRFGFRGNSDVAEARRVRSALLKLEPRHLHALFQAHGPTPWDKIIDASQGRGTAMRAFRRIEPRLLAVALLLPRVKRGFETFEATRGEAPATGVASTLFREPDAAFRARAIRELDLDPADPVDARLLALPMPRLEVALLDHFQIAREVHALLPRPSKKKRAPAVAPSAGTWLLALCLDNGEAAKKRSAAIKADAQALLAEAETAYLAARGFVSPPTDAPATKERHARAETMPRPPRAKEPLHAAVEIVLT